MTSRHLNILFMLLLMSALGIAVLSYFVWNDPKHYELSVANSVSETDGVRWYVDVCSLGGKKNKVEVRGWALVKGQPYVKTQVYAELSDGQLRKLQTFSLRRPQILKQLGLGKEYRFPGFSAGYRGVTKDLYTGRVIVKIVTHKGEEFSVVHQCKA